MGTGYGETKTFKTLANMPVNYLVIEPNPVPKNENKFKVTIMGPDFDAVKLFILTLGGTIKYERNMTFLWWHKRSVRINKNAANLTKGNYITKVIDDRGRYIIENLYIS